MINLTPEELAELQEQALQEEVQRQTATQSQQASNVDSSSVGDVASELFEAGLEMLTIGGNATIDATCAVASCVGDVAVGTVEVAGNILVGTAEVAGAVIGGLGDILGEILSG
ncbi:hypothetical protein D3C73_1057300 [compost metagenome]